MRDFQVSPHRLVSASKVRVLKKQILQPWYHVCVATFVLPRLCRYESGMPGRIEFAAKEALVTRGTPNNRWKTSNNICIRPLREETGYTRVEIDGEDCAYIDAKLKALEDQIRDREGARQAHERLQEAQKLFAREEDRLKRSSKTRMRSKFWPQRRPNTQKRNGIFSWSSNTSLVV